MAFRKRATAPDYSLSKITNAGRWIFSARYFVERPPMLERKETQNSFQFGLCARPTASTMA
jgi:hypothetical protein